MIFTRLGFPDKQILSYTKLVAPWYLDWKRSSHAILLSLLAGQAACVVMLMHVLTLSLEITYKTVMVTSHLLYPCLASKAQCFVLDIADDVK